MRGLAFITSTRPHRGMVIGKKKARSLDMGTRQNQPSEAHRQGICTYVPRTSTDGEGGKRRNEEKRGREKRRERSAENKRKKEEDKTRKDRRREERHQPSLSATTHVRRYTDEITLLLDDVGDEVILPLIGQAKSTIDERVFLQGEVRSMSKISSCVCGSVALRLTPKRKVRGWLFCHRQQTQNKT